jgi:hypothetical protein
MTARFVLLMVAVAGLAACESTKAVDTSPPSQPVAVQATPPSTENLVVRSPIVPDDDVVVADATPTPKKRVKSESAYVADPDPVDVAEPAAPVSKPDKPAKPAKPAKADTADAKDAKDAKSDSAPVTTADASSTPPPASPSDGAPTPADTAPDSATPTTDATPAADGAAPKSIFSDPSSFMQAQIGGFPVWLVALVGIVLLLALIVGLGGRRKPEEVV